jgi:hypothetical protein
LEQIGTLQGEIESTESRRIYEVKKRILVKMVGKKEWYLAALMTAGTMLTAFPLAAQNDPPGRVARIDRMQGDVSLMYPGANWWTEAPPNYPLTSGARLYTADFPSQVEIQSGGTEIRGWSDSDITLTNLTEGYEQIGVATGSVRVSIFSMNPGDVVEIDTPNGAVLLQQPGSYRIDAYPRDGASDLVVSSGTAVVAAPGGLNQEVGPGQAVQLIGANPTELVPVGNAPPDGLDNWSAGLDAAYRNSISVRYVSPYMVGYRDLDGNGAWTQEVEYGPVWYPHVDPGWRPYSAGYWAYVAPWGYTWIDDAPWGYAPFHYGRWLVVRGRWGWVPGPREVRPVYSPALVAFVGGPNISFSIGGGGVAAWFPLGIGEPYVPWYHCSPTYARNVNVTNVNVTYIHNTTIVNNFNTFVTTRTVNNVNNITVNNITYVNRTQVVVVPAAAMTSGHSVAQAQIKVTPDMQRQLANAPVHALPSAPPARPQLVAKTLVKAPVDRPTLLTPRGPAKATPETNAAKRPPAPLPNPKPATSLAKPAAGSVAGRPPSPKPASAATKPTPPPTATKAVPATTKPTPPPTATKAAPAATKPTPPLTATKAAPAATKPTPPLTVTKPTPAATATKAAPAATATKAAPAATKPTPPLTVTKPAPAAKKPPQKNPDETKPEETKPEDKPQ